MRAIVFELCCNDTEGEDVEVPYVKYNLPKRQWLPLSLGEQQFESLHIITILFLPDPHAFAPHSPDFYNPTPWVASLFAFWYFKVELKLSVEEHVSCHWFSLLFRQLRQWIVVTESVVPPTLTTRLVTPFCHYASSVNLVFFSLKMFSSGFCILDFLPTSHPSPVSGPAHQSVRGSAL